MSIGENRPGHILTCKCGGSLTAVLDSRPVVYSDIPLIRRRRICDSCGKRQTTFEMTEVNILSFQSYRQTRIAQAAARLNAEIAALAAMLIGDGDFGDDNDLQS